MVYQSFKYYLARFGVAFFLLFTLGYAILFFFHEIALPGVVFDDTVIKVALGLMSLFFGFVVYGVFGDFQFYKAVEEIKRIDYQEPGKNIIEIFDRLIRFTESSYFLPAKGNRLRRQVIQEYANYLLNNGREDERALNIYLKAFLQDTRQTKFRSVLASLLTQKESLNANELDLLLVMLKADNYQDLALVDHLAGIFLHKNEYSNKTEPVFLEALAAGSPLSKNIVVFLLPILVAKKRKDCFAAKFFLKALSHAAPEQKETIESLVSECYLDQRFQFSDPILHDDCQAVFNNLAENSKVRLTEQFSHQQLQERWQKVKLFRRGDKRSLSREKMRSGISRPLTRILGQSIADFWNSLLEGSRKIVFKIFEGLDKVGAISTPMKLIAFLSLGGLLVWGLFSLDGGFSQRSEEKPQQSIPEVRTGPGSQIHTIQIAAVTKKRQADSIVSKLKKNKVEAVYVLKTQRISGGYWYKIRLGKFFTKSEAEQLARRLMENKIIKNYFIIALNVPASKTKTGK
ncbi:MAG: SPOR domain-containing protein [Nitrospina sp.]|nr:MAG: SPOR domain-containing protein [Nitrospina sp.]